MGNATAKPRVSNVVAISSEGSGVTEHVCALDNSGTVWCWGDNKYGQLGNTNGTCGSSSSCSSVPITVEGLDSDIVEIVASSFNSCAVTSIGDVMCWGADHGSTPVQIPDVNGALNVTRGTSHGCAALSTGTAKCWGTNTRGQLGDGTTETRAGSVDVVEFAAKPTPPR